MATNPLSGIEAVGGLKGAVGIPETIFTQPVPQQVPKADFGELMNMAVKSLNETQISADTMMEKFAAGQNVELHNVVLAAQKASLTLQFALQVKNKITEAYQELMRMQI
ncbi:MAG TPA: flagellar hook-basal body complex protein FliE [bacterium]|nr:flagellar hook-basal body complex protein FliE [bacterium]